MEEKETIEILMENGIDWITQHLYLTFGVLVAVHLGVAWLLKKKPLALLNSEPLKVSEIYIYPIKSLRASRVTSAVATKYGLQYDRTFMLLKRTPTGTLENMAVCYHYSMTQFLTSLTPPTSTTPGTITVTFVSPEGPKVSPLVIPLEPSVADLQTLEVDMHHSATPAYLMPAKYSDWFSKCFGFDVVLAYLGDHKRDVLFEDLKPLREKITFADCAPYLVVSETSLGDVNGLLNGDDGTEKEKKEMDVTKFRPNIVVSGARTPWEEDFWSRMLIRAPASSPLDKAASSGAIELRLEHNCVRCKSINVDYATGEQAKGKEGEVLKLLQGKRRVDEGMKWSPVFGRYAYWGGKKGGRGGEGSIRVGDEVLITKLNSERTKFSWKLN